MPTDANINENELQVARIAVYDDYLSAPRVVDIPPASIPTYIEQIASKTYELSQAKGGSIPYTVIREVSENFIHAQFREPCISILDGGNTIRFADQGPGIEDKERAQIPGFTSATSEMKQYIRGVGSGLPLAKEYLRFSNGRLTIEDNIKEGTVITITVDSATPQPSPVVYRQTPAEPQQAQPQPQTPAPQKVVLEARDRDVLLLAKDMGLIGPTEINVNLGISVSTAYRVLGKLEDAGLLEATSTRSKRMLTEAGFVALEEQE